MAVSCPVGFDAKRLREEVSAVYARVAEAPDGDFHFHRGPEYAAEFLGYDAEELRTLPARSTAAFAGVGNPHAIGAMEPGEVVADIGSGGGWTCSWRQGALVLRGEPLGSTCPSR